jgi:hypothetical protein
LFFCGWTQMRFTVAANRNVLKFSDGAGEDTPSGGAELLSAR